MLTVLIDMLHSRKILEYCRFSHQSALDEDSPEVLIIILKETDPKGKLSMLYIPEH
jgi:hypothetical protein